MDYGKIKKIAYFYLSLLCIGMVWVPLIHGKKLNTEEVPESLKEWIPWALTGYEERQCLQSATSEKFECLWSSKLNLSVAAKGAQFNQELEILHDSWVPLPGSQENWPQEVKIDQVSIPVTTRQKHPSIFLKTGHYQLEGKFHWESVPEFLQMPQHVGLIDLNLVGQTIRFLDHDEQGKLWLKDRFGIAKKDNESIEDKLDVTVARLINDDIPMMLLTQIDLSISGNAREIVLDNPLPEDFVPLALSSSLPIRIEKDGTLHLQARAGKWTIQFSARSPGPVSQLLIPPASAPWPSQEVWVFQAQSHLRQVEIQGANAVDPQQMELPSEWKQLPAYLIQPDNPLIFNEIKRGDPSPAPNQLTLDREAWLDFAGTGFSFRDQIKGAMHQDWHLSINNPFELGRVSVNGRDQLITKSEDGREGVAIRNRGLNVTAESRINEAITTLPAIGWEHDFEQVFVNLNLPPAWKMWAVLGADEVRGAWLDHWNLLDLFMLFLIILSIGRIWGWKWGVLACITLLLTYHDPSSPRWIWLHVILASALYQVVPQGRLKGGLYLYRAGSLGVLLVIVLPFMLQHVRQGLYPQLQTQLGLSQTTLEYAGYQKQREYDGKEIVAFAPQPKSKRPQLKKVASKAISVSNLGSSFSTLQEIDPNAQLQTGPGIPKWRNPQVSLIWNGPVEKDHTLRLFLTPPWVNRCLSFLSALLWAILLFCLFDIRYKRSKGISFPKYDLKKLFTKLPVIALLLLSPTLAKAEYPSEDLLEQLRTRLLEPSECLPHCASVSKTALSIENNNLHIRQEVHAFAEIQFLLPKSASQWTPQTITIDGEPANLVIRSNGNLAIPLSKGIHQVLLAGTLPQRQSIHIDFPLKPFHVYFSSPFWEAEGIFENRLTGNQIQLKRQQRLVRSPTSQVPQTLEVSDLPSFVKIQRHLKLGLEWKIETKITRVSHPQNTITLPLLLLPGESITSENVVLREGKALLKLEPNQKEKLYTSVLKKANQLELESALQNTWVEHWKIQVSPLWEVKFEGIPQIHHQNSLELWQPEWKPWPGESLKVQIKRPTSVPGHTMTIDQSHLTLTPGDHSVKSVLTFQLRSSLGTQHEIQLPEDAVLQQVTINGKSQPIQQDNRTLALPIVPGAQDIEIEWKQKEGVVTKFQSPALDLGLPSVNSNIHFQMPQDRWILWVGGPSMGPAILFWGRLLIILFFALALGRVKGVPLRSWHWVALALGLSTVDIFLPLIFVSWILAMKWRGTLGEKIHPAAFNLFQLVLIFLTLAAFFALYQSIQAGLLGGPDMQIFGNGSYGRMLNWYQDRSEAQLPTAWVISLPILAYRIAMLVWALWMAFSLITWLKWCWNVYRSPVLWKPIKSPIIKIKTRATPKPKQEESESQE